MHHYLVIDILTEKKYLDNVYKLLRIAFAFFLRLNTSAHLDIGNGAGAIRTKGY